MDTDSTVLSINNLTIHYDTRETGSCKAVSNLDLEIRKGETLGLVGETGAGKTTVALGILGLIPKPPGKIVGGTISFCGDELLKKSEADMRRVRGRKISMIFQDPMTALNPIDTVGDQIAEVIYLHQNVTRKESMLRAARMMTVVGIPAERYGEYPHQFSGGMKQRVVIAIALACSPQLLLADEPTTALDVTIQAQVLEMMNALKRELGTAMLLITHDLGVVARMCDRVAIMYAGEIVELGDTRHIYKETAHPYTKGLFASLPGAVKDSRRLSPIMGMMPDPTDLPAGCRFAPRCRHCADICGMSHPKLTEVSEGHWVRCHFAKQGDSR